MLNEYEKQTGLSSTDVQHLLDEIKNKGLSQDEITSVEELIPPSNNYLENVLYVQDNYDQIISKLSAGQKKTLDKYFLYYALRYYDKNPVDIQHSMGTISNGYIVPESISSLIYGFDDTSVNDLMRSSYVAELQVFSDGTENIQNGSSGLSLDTVVHSFISVKNISNSNIVVGKLQVATRKTMVLGTWGNKDEHKGLWYNLEPKFIRDKGDYDNKVSLKANLISDYMNSLKRFITVNDDQWFRA